jgi:BirA family biotin operon repressor/biotin-[acetyl-CoA-carboxylase] ligase
MPPVTFTSQKIGSKLNTRRIGRQIVVLDETTSTNDVAVLAADRDDADGLVVFADYQTRGRGRLGRRWSSPRGASVLCTVLLIDRDDSGASPIEPGVLTLAAGVAVCDAISTAGEDLHPTIRWPNDVLIRRRKVAGVLIESCLARAGRAYAMGIGVNCLQHRRHFERSLERLATSMEAESSHPVSRLAVARQLLIELDRWLAGRPDTQLLRQAWLDRAEPLGQHIHLRQAGEDFLGRTIDVDPTAALVVQLDGGGRRVFDPATTILVRAGSGLHRGG